MKRFARKFHILEAAFAVFMILLFSFLFWKSWNENDIEKAKADLFGLLSTEFNNIRGWAWSENIGWVSFSHSNCDTNEDGFADAPGCPLVPVPNYGAHALTQSDLNNPSFSSGYDEGALAGHAWSESLGWISFDRAEVTANGIESFPDGYDPYIGKNYTAKIEQDGAGLVIKGWGRAIAGIGEPWEGWIKFYDNINIIPDYKIDVASGALSGYAWGGAAIGWLSFSGPAYGATLEVNPPTVSNLNASFADLCADNKNPTFSFTYNSEDGASLEKIDIEIIKQGVLFKSFSDASRTEPPPPNISITYGGGDLDRGQNYDWRVKVTDAFGFDSGWIEEAGSPDFYVEQNKRPIVKFDWSPKLVVPEIDINFMSSSSTADFAWEADCFNVETRRDCSTPGDVFSWSFPPDATPITSSVENPVVQFSASGTKNAQLSITGFGTAGVCSASKNITVSKPIPAFEEKRP